MGAGTLIGARLLQYSGALVLFGTSVFYLYRFRRVATSEAPAEQCPNVDRDGSFKLLNMIQKVLYFLGLYLNIDSPSRTVTAVLAAESLDAQGQLVFAQLMRHLPLTTFRRCVARYAGEHKVKSFSCLDQYLCMAFAQLTYRESLRDIESSLRAQAAKLYHLGIRSNVSRNTLANANATRDWRIYASFAERLIGIARGLYTEEPFGVDLAETVYALDATTIDLCL